MEQQQEQHSYVKYAILACVILTCLSLIIYCCFSCRRRRRRIIIKQKESKQAMEINVICSSESSENRKRESMRQIRKSSIKQETIKVVRKTVSKRKSKVSSDEDHVLNESYNWDDYNETFHKRLEVDDHEEEQDRIPQSKKEGQTKIISHGRDCNQSDEKQTSQRSLEIKEKRRCIESWNEVEKEKRRSNRTMCSKSSSCSVNDMEGKKKMDKKVRSRKHAYTIEESIRKARTILETVDVAKAASSGVKIFVIPALREIIELLEDEKWKLESRQKSVEEEKLRLQNEINTSKAYLRELHCNKQLTMVELHKAKVNKELIRSGSMRELAKSETNGLKSDLIRLREERDEMVQLLYALRHAEIELGQELEASMDTVGLLHVHTKRVGSQLELSEPCKVQEQKQMLQPKNHITECLGTSSKGISGYMDKPSTETRDQEDVPIIACVIRLEDESQYA